jgi:hypothetical protein
MQLESIETLAEKDLSKRGLKIGDYGLTLLSQDQIAKILGYHVFTKAPYGIGITYPDGVIGNIRMGSPFDGPKYLQTGLSETVFHVGNPSAKRVVITEGEFKAITIDKYAKSQDQDILAIGLFGVDGWSGASEGRCILSPLADLVRDKEVTIIFDYDGDDIKEEQFQGKPKEAVLQAELKLCATLTALGSKVSVVRIGRFSTLERRDKYAIDDYLLSGGTLQRLLDSARDYRFRPAGSRQSTLNEAQAYALAAYGVYNGFYVRLKDGAMLSKANALISWTGSVGIYSVEDRPVRPLSNIGDSSKLSLVEEWIYEPNEPYGFRGRGRFNMWRSWGQSVEGDCSLWTELCSKVLPKEEHDFFHDWIAYLIQNPGQKNFTYIALVSPQGGVGKSLIAETVMKMMEPSATVLDGERVFSKNNELLEGKALVVINELGSDKGKHVAEFKAMVTGDMITLEEKYKPARTVKNITNFIVTSNELSPLIVNGENRRDVIIRVHQQSEDGKKEICALAVELSKWLRKGGTRMLQYWYEQRDISEYNPKLYAPKFSGFWAAVEASKSNNQMSCDEVIDFIDFCGYPCFISKEMIAAIVGSATATDVSQIKRLLLRHPDCGGEHTLRDPGAKRTTRALYFGNKTELGHPDCESKSECLMDTQKKLGDYIGI